VANLDTTLDIFSALLASEQPVPVAEADEAIWAYLAAFGGLDAQVRALDRLVEGVAGLLRTDFASCEASPSHRLSIGLAARLRARRTLAPIRQRGSTPSRAWPRLSLHLKNACPQSLRLRLQHGGA